MALRMPRVCRTAIKIPFGMFDWCAYQKASFWYESKEAAALLPLRAGIRPGDIVTHVNGEPVVGQPLQRSVERTRGEVGTFGELTVQHAAERALDDGHCFEMRLFRVPYPPGRARLPRAAQSQR